MSQRLRWVIDIDIKKYFDSIPHSHLRDFLDRRAYQVARIWQKWLSRRDRGSRLHWRRFTALLKRCPLPAGCNAGASRTIQRSRRDRDNEAVLREPFTPNGGLVVQSGARSLRHRDAIIFLAARYKLPAVYSARDYASAGGLLSYRPDQIGH